MATNAQPGKKPSWRAIPTMDSSDVDVREWMNVHLNYASPRRRFQTQRCAENLWFFLGRQWIEAATRLAPHEGGYHFQEVLRHSNAAFPRPVTNYVAVAVNNEVSRLAKKQYVPDPTASKNQPEWMAAARLAKDISMSEMTKQLWEEKQYQLVFDLVINGIAIARSWWDENEADQTLIASPDAVQCPMCNRTFSSARVPSLWRELGMPNPEARANVRMNFADTAQEVPLEGEMSESQASMMGQMKLQHCPFCEQMSALQPYEMTPEEAGTEDVFGRPMGLVVPTGEGLIELVSRHEYFPENAGVGVEPSRQRLYSQVSTRPLEWIAQRFPDIADDLSPEDPPTLLRYHPLYSDQAFWGSRLGFGVDGYDVFYNHARVFEVIIPPLPIDGLEKGAWLLRVNDKIARRELCYEANSEEGPVLVPRVKFHFARFIRIPGHFDGRTFVDDLKPLNRRLNEIDAQGVDLRERGKPVLFSPEGTEFYYDDEMKGSLNVIQYDTEVPGWKPQDGLFPGIPLSGSPYAQERSQVLSDMQALGAPQDIEMGVAPGSVKTTSGLMLLSEEAAQKRAPRERALVLLYESVFTHLMQLNWCFRKEDETYEVQREGGVFEKESYTGSDLLSDIKVKMVARVGYDQTLYNKEAAAEALTLGLVRLDSPDKIDRMIELMKLPKDLNENQTLQVARAEQAWARFMRSKTVPAIDTTLFDAPAWYSVLGKRWLSDQAAIMQERSGWNGILPRLVRWQERMAQLMQAEAPAKAIYGNVPQGQWAQVYEQGSSLLAQAMAAYQTQLQSFRALPPPPPGTPPQQPPAPPPMQSFPQPPAQPFLPDALEQRIYTVWRKMLPELEPIFGSLLNAGPEAGLLSPIEDAPKYIELEALLRMRAVIEAFRLMAQGAAAGMPPPSPGGTPPGPPPGAPPSPPPGPPPPSGA